MVDKPKSGFQIPLNEWLRSQLKYLDESIFNIEEIMQLKKRFFQGTTIWFILMYQMWKEKWLD